MDPGAVVMGSVALVGGIVWLVRLEGRINLGDARWEDIKQDITEIKADVKVIRNGR